MDYAQPMSFNSSVDMFSRVCVPGGGLTHNSVYIYQEALVVLVHCDQPSLPGRTHLFQQYSLQKNPTPEKLANFRERLGVKQ